MLSTTLQVREHRETLLGLQLSHWGSDLKASWKKRILMWLSCKVAQVARCESLKHCTGGMKNMQGMTATSTEWWWPQEWQQTLRSGDDHRNDSKLYGVVVTAEAAGSSEPGLQSRPSAWWWTGDQMPRSPCKAGFTVPAAGGAVSEQPWAVSPLRNCLTKSHTSTSDGGRGIKAKPFWPKVGQIWWAVWAPNLLCHIQHSLCPFTSFLCLP